MSDKDNNVVELHAKRDEDAKLEEVCNRLNAVAVEAVRAGLVPVGNIVGGCLSWGVGMAEGAGFTREEIHQAVDVVLEKLAELRKTPAFQAKLEAAKEDVAERLVKPL